MAEKSLADTDTMPTEIEPALERLGEIVRALESEGTDLATSISLYSEGEALARRCREMLEQAELVVRDLSEEKKEGA